MNEWSDERKGRVLADFSRWLDELPEGTGDSEDGGDGDQTNPDLRDLFAEMAALRQEVRIQNREQSKAGRELARAAERYDSMVALMKRHADDLEAFEKRISRKSENTCLRNFLEVRDALARGLEAATELREQRGLFRRPPRGIGGVAEGYEIAIRRFDRMLSQFGVQRFQTTGRPFDARTMRAMETRHDMKTESGVVVEELLSGFVRDDEILRPAEVAVNRTDTQE